VTETTETEATCGFPCDDGVNVTGCILVPDHPETAHWNGRGWFHSWDELKGEDPVPLMTEPPPADEVAGEPRH
jgi:hypothetical protein